MLRLGCRNPVTCGGSQVEQMQSHGKHQPNPPTACEQGLSKQQSKQTSLHTTKVAQPTVCQQGLPKANWQPQTNCSTHRL